MIDIIFYSMWGFVGGFIVAHFVCRRSADREWEEHFQQDIDRLAEERARLSREAGGAE